MFAGQKSYYPLSVSATGHFADGGLSETHNTPDSVQYAECGSNSTIGFCSLRDAAGTYYSCFTLDPSLLTVIRSMSPDSGFDLTWDPTTGECTYVLSYASSRAPLRSP